MRYLFLLLVLSSCGDNPKPGKPNKTDSIPTKPVEDTFVLRWPDRRPIGMVMLANYKEPYTPGNRNWYLGGAYQFSKEALWRHAEESIKNAKYLNAQGVITWDIEGQEYPHAITYIGDPRYIPAEMEPYVDDYFKLFTDAGLRAGVTLRPDSMVFKNNWAYHYTVNNHYQNLYDKIQYAYKRWGCTLFYVDSNVGEGLEFKYDSLTGKRIEMDNTVGYGRLLSVEIFKALSESFPDCLIIPEHQNDRYYEVTAPFNDRNYRHYLTGEERIKNKNAFQVLAVGDSFEDNQLIESVKEGNVLMSRVWYPAPEINRIKRAYESK